MRKGIVACPGARPLGLGRVLSPANYSAHSMLPKQEDVWDNGGGYGLAQLRADTQTAVMEPAWRATIASCHWQRRQARLRGPGLAPGEAAGTRWKQQGQDTLGPCLHTGIVCIRALFACAHQGTPAAETSTEQSTAATSERFYTQVSTAALRLGRRSWPTLLASFGSSSGPVWACGPAGRRQAAKLLQVAVWVRHD